MAAHYRIVFTHMPEATDDELQLLAKVQAGQYNRERDGEAPAHWKTEERFISSKGPAGVAAAEEYARNRCENLGAVSVLLWKPRGHYYSYTSRRMRDGIDRARRAG